MTDLWHYTCDHGHQKLGVSGLLVPGLDLMNPVTAATTERTIPIVAEVSRFVWLTDLSTPIRDALGLTMNHLTCDRTRHRYRVTQNAIAVRWTDLRRTMDADMRDWLESAPGARPAHWWVAHEPVPVTYDPHSARTTA